MWARNSSRDAERAQDDADFGAAPGGGNRFPEDDTGHVTFRAAETEGVGPGAGDPNFRQSLTDAIAGLYLGDGNLDDEGSVDAAGFLQEEEEDEDTDDTTMVEAARQQTTGGGRAGGGRGGGRGRGRGGGHGRGRGGGHGQRTEDV
jgi:hypothetical protein